MAIVLADHFLRHRAQVGPKRVMRAQPLAAARRGAALQLPHRSGRAGVPRRQGARRVRRRVRAVLGLRQVHPEARSRPSPSVSPPRNRRSARRSIATTASTPRSSRPTSCSPTAAPTPSSTASPLPGERLGGPWRALALLRLLPRPLADWLYDRVAQQPICLVRPHRQLHDPAARVARTVHRVSGRTPMAAKPDVQALLFDVFGTVVDWRSSIIDDLDRFGAKKGLEGRLGALRRRLARPLPAGHGRGALGPPCLDHPRRAASREPGQADRQVRPHRPERGRQGPHQPRVASPQALARYGRGPDDASSRATSSARCRTATSGC